MHTYKGTDFIFSPSDNEKAVIFLLHGICEHSLRYTYFIKILNNMGLTCAAIDHPGHGLQVQGASEVH